MEHDLQVSRKCYKMSRNLGKLIDPILFLCKKSMLLVSIREEFGVNPRNADHRDLKLAPDGARTTTACAVIMFAKAVYLVVRYMAPLAELAPFSGATL